MRNKPKVGDEIFFVHRMIESPATVTKVGRKYFYVTLKNNKRLYDNSKFSIDDWTDRSEFSNYRIALYLTEKEYRDQCRREALLSSLRKRIPWDSHKLILDHLEHVTKILDEGNSLWPKK